MSEAGQEVSYESGFSHPVEMEDPEGIITEVPNQLEIIVKGADKQAVGNYAN